LMVFWQQLACKQVMTVTLRQPCLSIRNGYKQVLPSLLSLLVFSTRPKIKKTEMNVLQQHVISSHHQYRVRSSYEFVNRLMNAFTMQKAIATYTSYWWCKYSSHACKNCYKSLVGGKCSLITLLTSWIVVVAILHSSKLCIKMSELLEHEMED
jgi:hypothetical protein